MGGSQLSPSLGTNSLGHPMAGPHSVTEVRVLCLDSEQLEALSLFQNSLCGQALLQLHFSSTFFSASFDSLTCSPRGVNVRIFPKKTCTKISILCLFHSKTTAMRNNLFLLVKSINVKLYEILFQFHIYKVLFTMNHCIPIFSPSFSSQKYFM